MTPWCKWPIDNYEYTVGVFLDRVKAFDTVDVEILLGIRGTVLDWFRSYLTNRQQIVKYKSSNSNNLTIKCGVPQGPMLGPLLFLTFINDVCESSRILSLILFADDTNLFYGDKNGSTLVNTVNQALEKIWSGYGYPQKSYL